MPRRVDACCYFGHCAGLPYDWPGRPRRMAVAERALWGTFKLAHPALFTEVWYDAHIPRNPGENLPPPRPDESCDDALTRCWQALTCLRADVIGRQDDRYTIIELHLYPQEANLGRLRRYDWLARQHWPALNWQRPMMLSAARPAWSVDSGDWSGIDWWVPGDPVRKVLPG